MSARRLRLAVAGTRPAWRLLAWCAGLAFAAGQAAAAAAGPAAPAVPPSFKLYLSEPGVYRVTYEKLAAAGLRGRPESAGFALDNAGNAVPIWMADGGDGTFGPGDHLEFIGDRLPGESSWFNEYATLNVFRLSWSKAPGLRMQVPPPAKTERDARTPPAPMRVRQHFERDLVLLRFPSDTPVAQELWYWAKLTQIDGQPLQVPLDLPELDASSLEPVRLTVHLRGWSRPARKPDGWGDHRVGAAIAGREVATDWNNDADGERLQLELSAAELAASDRKVSLSVRPRLPPDSKDLIVDVVMLNWIEVSYPRTTAIGTGQVLVELGDETAPLAFEARKATGLVGYGTAGTRVELESGRKRAGQWSAPHLAGEHHVWLVPPGAYRAPSAIELDRPSSLAGTEQQADYIIVTHPRLMAAVQPLAEFHRQRGLKVAVVDVAGRLRRVQPRHPASAGDPRLPAPRLPATGRRRPRVSCCWSATRVGTPKNDARQGRGATIPTRPSRPGTGRVSRTSEAPPTPRCDTLNHRNLVPDLELPHLRRPRRGRQLVRGRGRRRPRPDMAIGRFPVTEPDEVDGDRRQDHPLRDRPGARLLAPRGPLGDQRGATSCRHERRAWPTRARASAASPPRRSTRPPETAPSGRGPRSGRSAASARRGELLVHFVGHGGRFIWRTGPPDWTKHRDLFNLDDIDQLPPSGRLPMVLSMTCYSAPFDHPTADSIGEKFLRVPGQGRGRGARRLVAQLALQGR